MAETVGAVAGRNVQRLREHAGLTQQELARLMLARGTPWTRSKIAAVEAGERPNLSLADALTVAHVLNVEVAALLEGDGEIALAPHVSMTLAAARDLVRGLSVLEGSTTWTKARPDELTSLAQARADSDARKTAAFQPADADQALARRMDVPASTVIAAARRLWGHTLTVERDQRVALLGEKGVSERQAHRGHITRELSSLILHELRDQQSESQDREES